MSVSLQDILDRQKKEEATTATTAVEPKPKGVSLEDILARRDAAQDTNVKQGKLKKDDLKKTANAAKIRDYMMSRFGYQYRDGGEYTDDKLVEQFFDHMRAFNTNVVSTASEARFVSKATELDKVKAKQAYDLYDQTGSVFVNDGVLGAVDGIKDYIFAAAKDPSNYLGLLTGGISKAAGFGITQGGKQAVKLSVAKATQEALKKGASREAAEKIGKEAGEAALNHALSIGAKNPAAKKIMRETARRERDLALRRARLQARQQAKQEITKGAAKKSLYATAATDTSLAVLQDLQIQNLMIDVESQDEYSLLQTGFSSLFGVAAPGAQIVAGKMKGKSGYADLGLEGELAAMREKRTKPVTIKLTNAQIDDVTADIKKNVRSWKEKVEAGRDMFSRNITDTDVFSQIILGANGKGTVDGLAFQLAKSGHKLPNNVTISDALSNIVPQLPEDELTEINKLLKITGITLGDATSSQKNLQDLVAFEASRGGSTLNVMSQAAKVVNGTLLHGETIISEASGEILKKEGEKAKRAQPFAYGQNLWRRMLVSSTSTTAVNVAGFAQYATVSTLADVLNGYGHIALSMTQKGQKAVETRRRGRVYLDMQAQKMRNLLDPYTTHDAYMAFLGQNKDVSKILFETVSGGVERTGKRYGVDTSKGVAKKLETIADAATKISGVRIQDSFTKSQMFMGELDKYVRLKHDKDLMTVLKEGDIDLIDNDVIGGALDQTLRSVFSKDYTAQENFLGLAAGQIEKLSNIPVVGTILPFGRFFNNVIATGYQWSAGGAVDMASALVRGAAKKGEDVDMLKPTEAFSRTLVAYSTVGLAIAYDEERRKKGLGVYEVESGAGNVIDMKSQFPASMFLLAGRILGIRKDGDVVPSELVTELGKQMAVGQFASDAQFGNDLNSIVDFFLNMEGDVDYLKAGFGSGITKAGGNYLSGYTRPLDTLNKLVGFATETDTAKDVRQSQGIDTLSQSSLKYVDNLAEVFIDAIDTAKGDLNDKTKNALTGEELRVGIREGEVYDPNPLAKVLGVTIKQTRTAAEELYSVAEMAPWTAGERSEIAGYDKVFNKVFAPLLERESKMLLADPKFKKANLQQRRTMVSDRLTKVRADVKSYLEASSDSDTIIQSLRRKASATGNRNSKAEAKRFMKNKGATTNIRDMNYNELYMYLNYLDYHDQVYKE